MGSRDWESLHFRHLISRVRLCCRPHSSTDQVHHHCRRLRRRQLETESERGRQFESDLFLVAVVEVGVAFFEDVFTHNIHCVAGVLAGRVRVLPML